MRRIPLVLLAASLSAPLAFAAETAAPQGESAPSGQSAVRVYVDPATGRRTSQPSEAARRAAAEEAAGNPAFNQSSEGLVERPAPGGGVIVDLQGRFQTATMIRVGKNGEREVYCTDATHADGTPHAHGDAPSAGREVR